MAVYWKVVHRGTLPSGEIFNHGHHLEALDGSTMAGLTAAVSNARTFGLTTAYLGNYQNSVSWVQADCYQVDINTDAAIDHGIVTGALTGTLSASQALPTEVACVLSERTAVLLRRGRGRMYLPPPGVTLMDSGGLFTSGFRTACVTAWKNYFNSLMGSGFTPSVRGLSTPGPGYVMRPIVSIDVGSVPDVQRRRRSSIAETRTSATL